MNEDGVSEIIASPSGVHETRPVNYYGDTYWDGDAVYMTEFGPVYRPTKSGVRMTHSTAMRFSPVWRAVSMISGDVSRLPLHLYRRDKSDTIEKAFDHASYRVLSHAPNDEMNAYMFWRRLMVQVLLWGAGYALLERDNQGRIKAAAPLCPDRTRPVYKDNKYYFETEIDHELYNVQPRDMLYLEWMSLDGINPLDVVHYARETWAAGLAAIDFTSKFFGRGGRLGGILELPSGLTPKARDVIEEGFRKQYDSAESAFMTVVLRDNAKFHAGQATFEQSQMIEGRKESVRDVARFYGVAPSRLGEESAASYNSKAEDNRDYLDTTLAPFLKMITSELIRKTLTDQESWPNDRRRPQLYWEHNTDDFLRMDTESRYRTYGVGIQYGIISPNEARRSENKNPRPGGDSYDNPNTSSGGGNGNGQSGNQAAKAAFGRLLAGTAGRMSEVVFQRAARKSATPQQFMAMIDNERDQRIQKLTSEISDVICAADLTLGVGPGQCQMIVSAYTDAIEKRLTWLVDNVAPAYLADEVERARLDGLSELNNRITTLVGSW